MRTTQLTAIIALALSLAACGKAAEGGATKALTPGEPGGAPTVAAAAPSDVCGLLSKADVEAASKVKVGAIVPTDATSAQTGRCEFQHADTASFGTSIIAALSVYKPEKIEAQKTVWTQLMKAAPVSGVGDYAYYNEAGGVVFAGKGGHAVEVQMLDGPAGPGRLEAIKTLAAEALSKL